MFSSLMLVAPGLSLHPAPPEVAALAKSLLFISFTDGVQPIVSLGWSLEYEMMFYLAVAALAATSRAWWTSALIVGASAFSITQDLATALPPILSWHFVNSTYLLEFALGVFAASLVKDRRIALMNAIAIMLALAALWSRDPQNRMFLAGVPSMALVWLAAWLNPSGHALNRIERLLATLGDASYSIYLMQIFSIPVTARLVAYIAPSCPQDVFLIVSIIVTVAAGYLVWRWIERPLLRIGRGVKFAVSNVNRVVPERT